MNKLIEKPHLFFFLAIPIIMLAGILRGDQLFDFNVYDTYFVIASFHLAILISILFGIIGIGYWITQKAGGRLSNWLNWIHIGLTLGGTLVLWILNKFYRTGIEENEFNHNLTYSIIIVVFLMIIGQLVFPINIIYGIIKKRNNPST